MTLAGKQNYYLCCRHSVFSPLLNPPETMKTMESVFKIWTTNRNILRSFLEDFSPDQLNKTPPGFSNNLIWNIGHVIVAQQALVYKASDLPMHVSDEMFANYKPGSGPAGTISQKEADELKTLLISLIEKTKSDFSERKFRSFSPFTTSMGFHLDSLNDAIHYNNYHEAMHLGFMMNIRKFI